MKQAGMCKMRGCDGRTVWVTREALALAKQNESSNQETIQLQGLSGASVDSLMVCLNHIRQRQDCPQALLSYLKQLSLHRLLELWHFSHQCGIDYVQKHVMAVLSGSAYAWQFFTHYYNDQRLYRLCAALEPQPYDIFISAIFGQPQTQTADYLLPENRAYVVKHLVVSPDKRLIIARCDDGCIRIFDAPSAALLYAVTDHVIT